MSATIVEFPSGRIRQPEPSWERFWDAVVEYVDAWLKPKKPRRGPGVRELRQAVTKLTTRRLDQRSAIAIAVRNLRGDLTRDLGGDLSRQQELVVEDACAAWIYLQQYDDFLLRLPSLFNKKEKKAIPLVEQRMKLAESFTRKLALLGLERKAKPALDLAAYLATKEAEPPAGSAGAEADNVVDVTEGGTGGGGREE